MYQPMGSGLPPAEYAASSRWGPPLSHGPGPEFDVLHAVASTLGEGMYRVRPRTVASRPSHVFFLIILFYYFIITVIHESK